MKKFIYCIALALSLSSCVSFGPQPKILYNRPEIDSSVAKVDKIIIFPTSSFQGKSANHIKPLDASINASWVKLYGKDKVIPAGLAIQKIADSINKDLYGKFVVILDDISIVEQSLKDENVKNFISKVTEKFGDYQLALAIVSGGEEEYKSGTTIYLNIGLFDTKTLTWKLITKTEIKKDKMSNYKLDSQAAVYNSFKVIKNIIN